MSSNYILDLSTYYFNYRRERKRQICMDIMKLKKRQKLLLQRSKKSDF